MNNKELEKSLQLAVKALESEISQAHNFYAGMPSPMTVATFNKIMAPQRKAIEDINALIEDD